jgi:hypothetical protein
MNVCESMVLGLRGTRQQGTGGCMICILITKYYRGDQIKKSEMGGACGTYGWRQEKCIHDFGGET